MEKLNQWIFLVIGILFLLPLINVGIGAISDWLIALGFLVIGIVPFFNK